MNADDWDDRMLMKLYERALKRGDGVWVFESQHEYYFLLRMGQVRDQHLPAYPAYMQGYCGERYLGYLEIVSAASAEYMTRQREKSAQCKNCEGNGYVRGVMCQVCYLPYQ